MAKVNDWRFFEQNVQSGLLEGRFMNAAFTMLAAGPPRLSAVSLSSPGSTTETLGDIAWPIGLLQSFNIGQSAQWMRLWEIGSERSYFIRGRVQGQLSLGRIMYHGPNLLRGMYAYLDSDAVDGHKFQALYPNSAKALLNTKGTAGTKQRYVNAPGHENLWLDLASDVFSQPVGLLIYFRDSNEDTVGAFYIEYCNVTNYGFSTDAGGTVISEQSSVLYERIVPVKLDEVALIKDSESLSSVIGATVIGSAAGPGSVPA